MRYRSRDRPYYFRNSKAGDSLVTEDSLVLQNDRVHFRFLGSMAVALVRLLGSQLWLQRTSLQSLFALSESQCLQRRRLRNLRFIKSVKVKERERGSQTHAASNPHPAERYTPSCALLRGAFAASLCTCATGQSVYDLRWRMVQVVWLVVRSLIASELEPTNSILLVSTNSCSSRNHVPNFVFTKGAVLAYLPNISVSW